MLLWFVKIWGFLPRFWWRSVRKGNWLYHIRLWTLLIWKSCLEISISVLLSGWPILLSILKFARPNRLKKRPKHKLSKDFLRNYIVTRNSQLPIKGFSKSVISSTRGLTKKISWLSTNITKWLDCHSSLSLPKYWKS